jgi:hypothetical protein
MSCFEKFWPGNEGVQLERRRLGPGNEFDHLFQQLQGIVTEIVSEEVAKEKLPGKSDVEIPDLINGENIN